MNTGHQASLRGLKNPQEVRRVILELLKRQRTAGLGDTDDLESRAVTMRVPDVLSSGSGESESLIVPLLQEVWAEARALRGVLTPGESPPTST